MLGRAAFARMVLECFRGYNGTRESRAYNSRPLRPVDGINCVDKGDYPDQRVIMVSGQFVGISVRDPGLF